MIWYKKHSKRLWKKSFFSLLSQIEDLQWRQVWQFCPSSLPATGKSSAGKLGPCDFCFLCFESSHRTCRKVKRRLFCQTWCQNGERHSQMDFTYSRNSSLAEKAKWHLSYLCAPLAMQAQCSCFIILSPNSVQNLELWIPQSSNNRNSVLKFGM